MTFIWPEQLVRCCSATQKPKCIDLQNSHNDDGDDEEGPCIATGGTRKCTAVEVCCTHHEEQHGERENEVLT